MISQLNREFNELANVYKEKNETFQKLVSEHEKCIVQVSQLTAEMQDINERIEDVKTQMESRNSKMTDMSPIRRLREAYKELKIQLQEMELKIGVARHSLLHAILKHESTRSARIVSAK